MPRAICNGGTLREGVTNARARTRASLFRSELPNGVSPTRRADAPSSARVGSLKPLPGGRLRVVLAAWAVARAASADPETGASQPQRTIDPVELRWVRLEGAEQCPPKAAFEGALQKRLGKASFTNRGSRVLTVTLSNEKGPFRVVLALKARNSDEVESKQELFSYSSSCDEVFNATVLSVALLLNPEEMAADGEELPEDTSFFDPPSGEGAGIAVPATDTGSAAEESASPSEEPPAVDIPVAPRPWARSHGAVAASLAVGLEQLPSPAMGFSARAEWPVARSWLLWLSADWLEAGPGGEAGVGVAMTQSSGWLGGAWLPYESDPLEVHLLGGLGVRQLTATLTDSDPRYHLALALGVGLVLELSDSFALDTRAMALVPLRSERVGSTWTQPAIGGQLQLGAVMGIPNPPAPK